MHVVYIIQHNSTKQIYIGQTANLNKRLTAHNHNNQKSTRRKNGKWVLIYAEAYRSKIDAIKRELKLKQHGSSKHELKKRIKDSLLETKSEAG